MKRGKEEGGGKVIFDSISSQTLRNDFVNQRF